MYRFARNEEIDLEELRARLRKMTDDDLLHFGKAARFMCRDKSPRQVFVHSVGRGKEGMEAAASDAWNRMLNFSCRRGWLTPFFQLSEG